MTAGGFLFQPRSRPGDLNATRYHSVEVTEIATDEMLSRSQLRLGGRLGCFCSPLKGYDVFIEPTWNVGAALNDRDTTLPDGRVLKARGLQLTGILINIGGALDLNR